MGDFRAGGDCVCRSLMEAGNVCGGSSNDNGEHRNILPFIIRRDLPHLYLGAAHAVRPMVSCAAIHARTLDFLKRRPNGARITGSSCA
jgi:hypothetical protein